MISASLHYEKGAWEMADDMTIDSSLEWFAKATGSHIVEGVRGESLTEVADRVVEESERQFTYVGGYAETDPSLKDNYVDLNMDELSERDSFFRYFMDGSRSAVKVAEFRKDGKVWPIVAGQIGVACCKREGRKMVPLRGMRIYRNVLSVPYQICGFGVNKDSNKALLEQYRHEINSRIGWGKRIKFDALVAYKDEASSNKENLAVSLIQSLMVDTEKQSILQMANDALICDGAYLIKDGSLEYMDTNLSTIKWSALGNNLQYAIGVSKSFNPDLFEVRVRSERQSAASFIAGLKVGQRTHAFKYSIRRREPPYFAVWFVRIRDPKLTKSAFDGVLKVEMQLVGEEAANGKSSLEINRISADLVRERNPVCYGSDDRWANHIYPVFITEKYLKSGFLPETIFKAIAM